MIATVISLQDNVDNIIRKSAINFILSGTIKVSPYLIQISTGVIGKCKDGGGTFTQDVNFLSSLDLNDFIKSKTHNILSDN
jgi:hypothetical protein